MISEASFQNLQTLRAAAHKAGLCVAASTVVTTGEKVALVSARQYDGRETQLVPLGCLCAGAEPMVDGEGRLTEAALQKYEYLLKKLLLGRNQAWLFERDQRVQVAFLPVGVDGADVQDCQEAFTLTWGNPYELFEDPSKEVA